MRKFNYITVGQVLKELNDEVRETFLKANLDAEIEDIPRLSRETFYRLEKRLNLPTGRRTTGVQPWRVYSIEEKELIKKKIKEEYRLLYKRPY